MSSDAFVRSNLRSILLPITTPFRSDAVDHGALRANIDRWSTTGIGGYVMLGSTGERVHLDEREYLEVIASAREEVDHAALKFIAAAGQQSTHGTINETNRVAPAVPVDAFLVITP